MKIINNVLFLYFLDMVSVSNITNQSASVSWRIPSFTETEQYYVEYGTDPTNLDTSSSLSFSPGDASVTDAYYTVPLDQLNPGMIHYLRVVAKYRIQFRRFSETVEFRTKENGIAFNYFVYTLDVIISWCVFSSQSKLTISHF